MWLLGAEAQHRQLGRLAEAPRPHVMGQGPSWGNPGVGGADDPLNASTVSALGRAGSEAWAELVRAEKRWCDAQQFRHGVHKGV